MIRSLLYVPASNAKFIEKSHTRGADAIILDLEDAVAFQEKEIARNALDRSVTIAGQSGAKVFVRINNDNGLSKADAIAACRAGAYGLYLPKVSTREELEQLVQILAPVEKELGRSPLVFVPLIEDPSAVFDARDIAKGPRVLALSAGAEDIATAMGALPVPEVIRLPKLLIHLAAKAAGVLSFGLLRSVSDYGDHSAMEVATIEARNFGFDGASCIHPAIIPMLNKAFSPNEEEVLWAQRVIEAGAAHDEKGVGAFTLDGKFIDAPIIARARNVLARHRSIHHK